MKPNYLIIGAPKAGTTTLCEILSRHPEIYMFPHKEIHFFSYYYDRGFDWYESKFNPLPEIKAVGEGSPSYAGGNLEVVKRIARHLPEARLIYMVRHPVKRIESDYVQQLDNGKKYSSLAQAFNDCPTIVENSRYWTRINEFRQYFSDRQILVIFLEEFSSDPQAVASRCFEFLQVDPAFNIGEFQQSLNTRNHKQTDYPWMAWLRRQSAFLDIKWLLPTSLTKAMKPLLRKPLKAEVKWDREDRQQVVRDLTDDTQQFLQFYGKPKNYWNLEE